ncbi:MAG: methyltransferase domain-containing protein, partial [Gemmatimonadaceae bacterium]
MRDGELPSNEDDLPHDVRPCPVCGGAAHERIFAQRFAAVSGASLHAGYDVVVCSRCGAGFADRIPAQPAFDAYYRDMSKYEYHQRDGAESEYDRKRMEVIAAVVAPYIPSPDSRILDIGCASGSLLHLLRQRGFVSVTGMDPSPGCAQTARRLYDLRVVTATLDDLPTIGERFDFAILVGVLEHVRELSSALAAVRSALSPRGRIYVEVPDVLTFTDWSNAPFQDFSTEHINFFSPTSLANLMRVNGFVPVFSEQNARHQSFGTVMSNIS